MTNAEISIKMKEMENEYEATKNKVSLLLQRLGDLDSQYIKCKVELQKRTNWEIN